MRALALVGLILALAVPARAFPPGSLGDLGAILIVGAPVAMPWIVLLLFGMVKPARASVTWIERAFYAGLVAYDVALFVYLPGLMSRSEGFVIVPVWGVAIVLSCLVVAAEAYGRWREARRSGTRPASATSSVPSRSGRDPRSPAP